MKNPEDHIRELEDRCKALERTIATVCSTIRIIGGSRKGPILRRQSAILDQGHESYDNRDRDYPDLDPDDDDRDCTFGR
jgi:hypothetical protein